MSLYCVDFPPTGIRLARVVLDNPRLARPRQACPEPDYSDSLTIYPRNSDPFNIVTYYNKMGYYFLDTQYNEISLKVWYSLTILDLKMGQIDHAL